ALTGAGVELPWGRLVARQHEAGVTVAAGADAAELAGALGLSPAAIRAEAEAHAAACDRLPEADPALRSLVLFGTHAGLASVRSEAGGAFAGLAAGLAYSAPARSYFRDAYWTCPLLLQLAPDRVRAQIDLLATGVQADGEAPSGVIVAGSAQAQAWEAVRRADPAKARAHLRPGEWWSDHFDSPLFFVLMVADYVRATGDARPVDAHWDRLAAVFRRYAALAAEGGGLPRKPRHDRDWADNVFRSGLVAYDLGLWVGAAEAMAELGRDRGPALAQEARAAAARARAAIAERLWRGPGWPADYLAEDGFVEDHLALDALTLAAFGALPDRQALGLLEAVRRRLARPWGLACVDPPYRRRADLRAKSAFPGRYHNGGDWPWLDGLYARERLRRGLAGWRAPLTRWWETCLANGWPGAVEHFSPAFGRGSLIQAWSSLPAAVALAHREAVLAGDPG
ncbi:amylo-alpha-1,6-glucosidase, partial [Phenylobacterium terrae]